VLAGLLTNVEMTVMPSATPSDDSADIASMQQLASPELVLVDPELRRRLSAGSLSVARVAITERAFPSTLRGVEPSTPEAPRLRSLIAAACAVALALAFGITGNPIGRREATSPTSRRDTAGQRAVERKGSDMGRASDVSPANLGSRRLAWAPARRAVGYRVKLFRGSAVVYSEVTRNPYIVIPRDWRFRGSARTLRPGTYRWVVRPIVPGVRRSPLIVRAELAI
jgi:hypothetical protein